MPLSYFPPEIQRLYWMERFPLGGVPSTCSGFDAERGKLINAFSTHRGRGRIRVEVIRYWPAPRMWVRERIKRGRDCAEDSGWRRGTPRRGVHFCHDPGPKTREDSRAEHALRTHHINQAISRIPPEVRHQVCRFSRRHHWALLNLFWVEPRFCERASTQPILTLLVALALANTTEKGTVEGVSLRDLVSFRGHEVLRVFGWKSPRSALKLMEQLDRRWVEAADLERIKKLLASSHRWVQHLPAVTHESLVLIDEFDQDIEFAVVEELTAEPLSRRQREILRGLRELRALFAAGPPGRRAPRIRSRAHLEDVIEAEKNEAKTFDYKVAAAFQLRGPVRFPEAPFPGCSGGSDDELTVSPLTRTADLTNHARVQKNCLVDNMKYLKAMFGGDGAAYEVLARESSGSRVRRGTLFLDRDQQEGWKVGEFKLTGNKPPASSLVEQIEEWLREQKLLGGGSGGLGRG